MNIPMLLRTVVLLVLSLFSVSAMAQGYFGFGIGVVERDLDEVSTFDDPTGFELIGGVDLDRNLAFEVSYIDYGEADDGIPPEWHVSGDSLAFGVLGKAPISRNSSFYGKIGLHLWNRELTEDGFGVLTDDSGADLFFGFGFTAQLQNNVGIGARYNFYLINGDGLIPDEDVQFLSLNIFITL